MEEPLIVDLGYTPKKWQYICHIEEKRFNCDVVHRRAGKSYSKIMKLIDKALKYQPPADDKPGQWAFIGPYKEQTKKIAWNLLASKCNRIPGCRIDESELTIWLPNNNNIWLGGADNPKSIRGTYLNWAVLDEVADIKPTVWSDVIYPMLQDYNGGADLQGTPNGINLLSETYYQALDNPAWAAHKFTVYDTDVFTPEQIDQFKKDMSSEAFAREFLCDFSAGNASALLNMTIVEESCRKPIVPEMYKFAPRIMGVDVARQGNDSSVIYMRQGLKADHPIEFKGLDAMQVASQVAVYADNWKPHKIFVDGSGGYGAGVIDRLRQLNYQVIEVQFGGKPLDERFNNKRTEMWWSMAEWVKQGGVLPNHARTKLDLCAPHYDHRNAAGKMALESKDKIKERGMPSPDFGDALALTWAFPVYIQTPEEYMMSQSMNKNASKTYNPLIAAKKRAGL